MKRHSELCMDKKGIHFSGLLDLIMENTNANQSWKKANLVE